MSTASHRLSDWIRYHALKRFAEGRFTLAPGTRIGPLIEGLDWGVWYSWGRRTTFLESGGHIIAVLHTSYAQPEKKTPR